MERLWKHIDHVNLRDAVTGCDQQLQISGQSHGIARDVDDLRRRNPRQQSANLGSDTGARGIHHYQVRSLALDDRLPEELDNRRCYGATTLAVKGPCEILRRRLLWEGPLR